MHGVTRTIKSGRMTRYVRDWVGEFSVVSRDHLTESVQVPPTTFRWLRAAQKFARKRAKAMVAYYGTTASYTIRVYDMEKTEVVFELTKNLPQHAKVD